MISALKDINWNQLYYFYEVGRRQSIKEAAKTLGLSSPTLSEHIKKLEARFNLTLFQKKSRKFVLTSDGQELFFSCREIFENGRRIIDNISKHSVGGYAVKIGIQESLVESLGLQFVSEYNDLFAPYGTVHTIRETNAQKLTIGLDKGEYDWVISLEPIKSRKTQNECIESYTLGLATSPEIFSRFKKKEDLLNTIPLSLSNWDHSLNKLVLDYLGEHSIFPEEFIYTDHREFSIHLAERGRCITLFPFHQPDAFWESRLKIFTLDQQKFKIKLYASWRELSSNMISIQKLKECLKLKNKPFHYNDQDLLIDIANIPEEKLK